MHSIFRNSRARIAAANARLVIIAAPSVDALGKRRHDRFEALIGDRVLVQAIRTRFLSGCRALIELGFDPNDVAVMKHAGSNTESLRATIGAAAKFTVEDNQTGRPFCRRHRERPESDGAARPCGLRPRRL
jgi:hypothetical protein